VSIGRSDGRLATSERLARAAGRRGGLFFFAFVCVRAAAISGLRTSTRVLKTL
jgi:hypothetical protein